MLVVQADGADVFSTAYFVAMVNLLGIVVRFVVGERNANAWLVG